MAQAPFVLVVVASVVPVAPVAVAIEDGLVGESAPHAHAAAAPAAPARRSITARRGILLSLISVSFRITLASCR